MTYLRPEAVAVPVTPEITLCVSVESASGSIETIQQGDLEE